MNTSTAAGADGPNLAPGQGTAPTNEVWMPEKHVDMVTCINNLTTSECRQLIMNLDDMHIRNLIKHHAHSYGKNKWANGIQGAYVNQVKKINKGVARFDYIEDLIKNQFKPWDQHSLSNQHGDLGTDAYQEFESHVRLKLWPSINHIGVVCTYSDYIQAKRNGLTSLINIGELVLSMGMFTKDPKGRDIFACYDGLSRAVANILHSAANLKVRHQILDHGIQQALEHLQKRGEEAGLFADLGKAINGELAPCPYDLPDTTTEQPLSLALRQPAPKRKARGEGKKPTKRTKKNTQSQNKDPNNIDHLIDPRLLGGPTTSQALETSSSEQQDVVKQGGFYTQPDDIDNPFAPPFTATGIFPVAPTGTATTSGSPVAGGRGITKQETGHAEASQAFQTPVRNRKGPVAKYVVTPQEVERHQAQEQDALGLYDDEDVKVARQLLDLQFTMQQEETEGAQQMQQEAQQALPVEEETAPAQKLQAEQQHQATQQNAPVADMTVDPPLLYQPGQAPEQNAPVADMTGTAQQDQNDKVQPLRELRKPPNFRGEYNMIHHLMVYQHANQGAQRQVAQAPFVCRSIEGSCFIIMNTTRNIADAHKGGDDFLYITQYNALRALLWIMHTCAIDTLGTPLSGEVCKQLRREALTMALWGCVKPVNGNPEFMNRLFNDHDPTNEVTIGVKLHAIILSLQKTGVKGYERLKYILDEMSGSIDTNQVAALI
ncbi:hypothetical protein VPNG_06155 [Cytospora leucostoma]|uniref:Uncharacterized protein n=1 Tax=Cytospora leucostoma TaxID=1230097 RepID=A0A423WYR0_9PEZI|nr:hypothetical protein VPNG_06155 [Cytospora leucostoma]